MAALIGTRQPEAARRLAGTTREPIRRIQERDRRQAAVSKSLRRVNAKLWALQRESQSRPRPVPEAMAFNELGRALTGLQADVVSLFAVLAGDLDEAGRAVHSAVEGPR